VRRVLKSSSPWAPGTSMNFVFTGGGLNTGRVVGIRRQSVQVFFVPNVIEWYI